MGSNKKPSTEKTKPGRPPKIEGRLDATVQTILKQDDFERLRDMASSKGQSVSALVREAVLDFLHRSGRSRS